MDRFPLTIFKADQTIKADTKMTDTKKINCATHGTNDPSFVCVHLATKSKVGFNPATEPDPDPEWAETKEAFCDRCYYWWNKPWPFSMIYFLIFAKPRVVCSECLEDMRLKNDSGNREKAWWE
jgi:hypothetical protein